ncbi:DUF4113 domain-containing protein (plasmid) [Klebsiella pneumoniae]|nr:DUF4113 domain-containing protein [Klebsiella pneumoniae]
MQQCQNFSVVLERTVRELNGESCLSLEEAPPTKQQIVCSRSFGVKITEYELQLFDERPPRPHSAELMRVLDGINNSGLCKVWFAGRGIAPSWQMKRDMLSPAYTTRWRDIPVARIG